MEDSHQKLSENSNFQPYWSITKTDLMYVYIRSKIDFSLYFISVSTELLQFDMGDFHQKFSDISEFGHIDQ
jgi:hypothetical protein